MKAGVLTVGILGLLTVITFAARGGHPVRHGGVAARPVPVTLQDSFVTLLEIAYVLAIVGFVVLFAKRRPLGVPRESHWLRNFILVMVLCLIVTAFGSWAIRHGHYSHQQLGAKARTKQGQADTPGAGSSLRDGRVRPARFQWQLAAGLAGLVLLGVVLILVRRRSPPGPDEQRVEDELVQTIDSAIEDLRGEGDPRVAVIASYASMESALRSHGFGRVPSEAPLEYLSRILETLEVRSDAVRSLTHLFEYAKFSRHEIDGEMKEDAIVALLNVRNDLIPEESAAA